jgi:hypothetical protein
MVASLVAVALQDSTGLFRGENVAPGESKAEPDAIEALDSNLVIEIEAIKTTLEFQ